MIRFNPIQNHEKYKIKVKKEKTHYDNIHHGGLFENIASIRGLLIGPSGTGKTNTLENITSHMLTPKTNLFFVSATKDFDSKQKRIYKGHIKKLKRDDIVPHVVRLYDDGLSKDAIQDIDKTMTSLQKMEGKLTQKKKQIKPIMRGNGKPKLLLHPKKKREVDPDDQQQHVKTYYAKNFLIIDDSDPRILSSMPLYNLIKKIRHLSGSSWILSQSWNDVSKRLRNNCNVVILCPGITTEKLEDIYSELIHKYPWLLFKKIYNDVAKIKVDGEKKTHDFLTIFRDSQTIRRNMNEDINIPDRVLKMYWDLQRKREMELQEMIKKLQTNGDDDDDD